MTDRKVFTDHAEAALFRRVRYEPEAFDQPVAIRVGPCCREPLLCRPGTTDAQVLWDTFYHGYHLPPRSIHPAGWVLDLGANVGYTAAHFATLYPQARIVAVEMDPANAELCRRNLAPFGSRCEVVQAAVWPHDGEIEYGGDQAWSLRVLDDAEGDHGATAVATAVAPAISIATLLERFAIDSVDYVKMDIEGAEAGVLQDARAWADRVQALKVEVHPPATMAQIRTNLTASGFACRQDTRHPNCLLARQ